jgi:peptide deformylase
LFITREVAMPGPGEQPGRARTDGRPSAPDLDRRPLRLRLFPDPALRGQARPLARFGRAPEALARAMLELMHAHHGIGLAAPQIGLPVRLIVADIGEGPVCLVNPLLSPSPARDCMTEGCLSLPGVEVEIERSRIVEVRGLDPSGTPVHFEARGLLARVLQHEVDHLDGVLIIDYPAATAGRRSFSAGRGAALA